MCRFSQLPTPSDEYYTGSHDDDPDMYWDIMDEIADEENEYIESEKHHGQYYLGIVKVDRRYNEILMSTSMSLSSFYTYDIITMSKYLELHSEFKYRKQPRIHIIQLHIEYGVYKAVIKTFWLRIIQRTWKRIYKEKMRIVTARGHPNVQHYFATHGKYPPGLNWLPGLDGMMQSLLSSDSV